MDFGRLPNVDGVDFRLPRDTSFTAANLRRFARPIGAFVEVRTGAPVFANRDFVGKIYPRGTKSSDYLRAYAGAFSALELNSTYYHLPTPETVDKWLDATPEGFRICPKVPEALSHSPTPDPRDAAALRAFTEHLAPRLGPLLLQLPPSLAPADRPQLDRLLDLLPSDVRVAVELRHPGWFRGEDTLAALAADLADRGAALAITDSGGRRDAVHMGVTAPFTFVRFAGHDLHPSDLPRLDAWVERLESWASAGLGEIWFFMHQPIEHLCADLVWHFEPKLRAALGLPDAKKLEPPPKPAPAGQLTLFGGAPGPKKR